MLARTKRLLHFKFNVANINHLYYYSTSTSIAASMNNDREYLWESDMISFWESLNFSKYYIDILINLGHGKYTESKLLLSSSTSSNKCDINKFAEYTLEQCKHLRSPNLTQRYLQNVQKLFPNMILNKAIYYNPYFLTLTLSTIEKRKCDLIDLIATHLSQETNPNKYDYLFKIETNDVVIDDNKNNEYLNKSDILELLEWDKFFENVSTFLTKDFGEIIKQIHILRKLFCVNYKNEMGLSQIEFIELFEVYPNILKIDYLSFMAKFRFLIEFASSGILKKKKIFFNDEVDFTLIGNEDKYSNEISFNSYENMLNDERILNGYKLILKYLIFNGTIFNYSWNRLSRIKYWSYNNQLRQKYSIKEIITMNTKQFVNISDKCWKAYCLKSKKNYQHNVNLNENWRDNNVFDDKYMDYQEFMRNELRSYMDLIVQWNNNDIDDTKSMLKKNKSKLREPFINNNNNNDDHNKPQEKPYYNLIEKEEYKMYLNNIEKLEKFHSRLNRTLYTPNSKDVKNFLKNPNDFGFNYQLKHPSVDSTD